MSETGGGQEESAQMEVQQVTAAEDKVHPEENEAVISTPGEQETGKPAENERDDTKEEKSQANEQSETSPKEQETAATAAAIAEPVAKQPRKFRCFDPAGTVDITTGQSGIRAIQPITIPQLCQKTFDKLPNGKALCWKDNKEEPWKSLTYAEYRKLIYNIAKSFLKVLHYSKIQYDMFDDIAGAGALSCSGHSGVQLSGMVCI